jgi:hypothetical protein
MDFNSMNFHLTSLECCHIETIPLKFPYSNKNYLTLDISLTIQTQTPIFIHKSMAWFKGKILGNTHISSYFIIFYRKIYGFPHIS